MKAQEYYFPVIDVVFGYVQYGADLRTVLAGMAMQGFIAREEIVLGGGGYHFNFKAIANMAVAQADALIEELNKEKK